MNEQQKSAMNYLKRYIQLKKEAEQLDLMIKEIDESMDGLKAQILTGMPHGSSPGSSLERAVVKLEDKKKEYVDAVNKSVDERLEIELAINAVFDSRERRLLRYRYIFGMSWEEVCVSLGVKWNSVHRIHREALEDIKINANKD